MSEELLHDAHPHSTARKTCELPHGPLRPPVTAGLTLRGLRASFAATVVSPSKAKSKDWEGPSLRTVLVGLSLVAVAMGVFSYYRYVT